MIELLTSQLGLHTTKDSQEAADDYKKVITEMSNVVVGIVKEILPNLTEQEVCTTSVLNSYIALTNAITVGHS